ncbi:MAG: sulfite exporter TauE/SafE family protein [Coriobacteriia bacterium]|nr:sulfite exporter TauE/SafE family protein [Coriobacteriia bacterium]
MRQTAITLGIGFVSGVLSGAFGIGGGIVTTPAIRLILGAPALIAVGTPLPVILPSALTGAYNYYRRGIIDVRTAVACGLAGSLVAVASAYATRFVGGEVVLIATAMLILYVAADVIVSLVRPPRLGLEGGEEAEAFAAVSSPPEGAPQAPQSRPAWGSLLAVGALTGFYSGFLGLGGGFVLVPLLTRWLHFDIKRAIGTSLLAISILAIPGTITHALLGHIDWAIALSLALGVVPGAWLGARITLGASDRSVKIAFAALLVLVGVWLGASELAGFLR